MDEKLKNETPTSESAAAAQPEKPKKSFREMTLEERRAYHKGSENLRPIAWLPKEEQEAVRAKARAKSAEKARKIKSFKEDFRKLMAVEADDKEAVKWLREHELDDSNQMLLCLRALQKAQTGDIEAARFIRDTLGQKPVAGLTVNHVDLSTASQYDLDAMSTEELMALADQEDDFDPDNYDPDDE